MSSLLRIGQLLRGKTGTYTIIKQLHESIWLARYEIYLFCALSCRTDLCDKSNQSEQTVVIKSIRHFRLENERDILKHFQSQTSSLRPLIDEIEDPSDPPALVLKHLDDDLLNASTMQRLTRQEIKHVAKTILEALKVLHGDGYVHTGMLLLNNFQDIKWSNPG